MSDPLGLIGGAGGAGGLNRAGGPGYGSPSGVGGAKPEPGQPSFKDLLMENIKQANQLQNEATAAIEDLHTGQRSDVEGVIAATQKADVAFKMLMAVRNKVAQAYEEVKQMRT